MVKFPVKNITSLFRCHLNAHGIIRCMYPLPVSQDLSWSRNHGPGAVLRETKASQAQETRRLSFKLASLPLFNTILYKWFTVACKLII